MSEAITKALTDFECKERGIPQAHMAAQLVAELRAALSQAGQGGQGEPVMEIVQDVSDPHRRFASLCKLGDFPPVGTKLFALPPAQPAPVDEREALRVLLAAVDAEMSDEWTCISYHPSLVSAAEQARAALQGAQAPQAGGWLPIETAPKDGQRLILWWGGKPVFAGWLDNSQCKYPWAGWQTPSLTPRPQGEPTHWQPLP